MRFLRYSDLHTARVERQFAKVREAIERGDLKSAEVKKLSPGSYYRAKLDDTNRLLLQFLRYQGQTVCLALEVIHQHAYHKSRFLRGARVDEDKIVEEAAAVQTAGELRYLNPQHSHFYYLDKVLSFDEAQDALLRTRPPLVIVGSAGSGKTALTLEKLKHQTGQLAYITLSAYLAQGARNLYFAQHFEREEQDAVFLSFKEFLETIRVPQGRELSFRDFRGWFERHRTQYRFADAHQLFEEFRGVLSSQPEGPLNLEEYLGLGVRQSLFGEERSAVHALFLKYQAWLKESGLYDTNLLAHQYQGLAQPTYDFVVVDEVQDFTNAQLALILRTLKHANHFLLCGDSNQVVHPNFFSWSAVKSLFWRDLALAEKQHLSVLRMNFRNTPAVTRVANDLLKIKHARFGSVDYETNFLVQSMGAAQAGSVELLPNQDALKRELDQKTHQSAQFAVLVLREEDKAAARQFFRTPLLFSVHEAKGLEYPNVILYNFVGANRPAYAAIAEGVVEKDLEADELRYARARDKSDKSLQIYKFYVNSLYVAVSRGVDRVILVESDVQHPLLRLLGLREGSGVREAAQSSREEWEREAQKLELQGKQEQAQAIRQGILKVRPVPWEGWSREHIRGLQEKAFAASPNTKAAQRLYEYALWNQQDALLLRLVKEANQPKAKALLRSSPDEARKLHKALADRFIAEYAAKNFKSVLWNCDFYGTDFRTPTGATPLMLGAHAGNLALVEALLERGADPTLTDPFGQTAAMYALNRAFADKDYAQSRLGPIWERVAPPSLDVQVESRLIRLYPHMAEYFFLSAMLAGLKTLRSGMLTAHRLGQRRRGFFVDHLMRNVEFFPHNVLTEERRKRTYFNHVLARAEVNSAYTPARKLWVRVATGYYLPNPAMLLRVHQAEGEGESWQPVTEVFDYQALGISAAIPQPERAAGAGAE